MDGNGRWAQKRGLPRSAGHKKGAQVFEQLVKDCSNMGIKVVTAYAFSTENWKRPKAEVDAIMDLLGSYLDRLEKFHREENGRLRFLGDKSALAPTLREKMEKAERESAENTGIQVNIAVNYGGRAELVRAAQQLAQKACRGEISPDDITEEMVSDHLYTSGQPDPDLIVRPSGEERLSNFMVWQSAYAEFVFMDVLWPDFNREHLTDAIWQYARRNRRFGGV
jgi:undecaprenyl diphosphate synthase